MAIVAYYGVFLFFTVLCWPYSYGARTRQRIGWIVLGLAIVLLPLALPVRNAFYYGLLGNFTIFFWSADTFMEKQDRRARALIGGVVLALLPLLWKWPLENWTGTFLLPTLGHALVSGSVWGLVLAIRGR